jgi:glutathione S-transferase
MNVARPESPRTSPGYDDAKFEPQAKVTVMAEAMLSISSKNYSSWSLRGWLLCKLAGLDIEEQIVSIDDPSARAELLLLSPSFLVPCLTHDAIKVWDTLAIADYLAEIRPEARLLPEDRKARAHCRSISGEMHSGFYNLRSALPMNLRAFHPGFQVFPGAQADIDRVVAIWRECLNTYGGPYLFGSLSMADAMYAPVCSRFLTYDVKLDSQCGDYCRSIMVWPAVEEWVAGAKAEPDEVDELDVEF